MSLSKLKKVSYHTREGVQGRYEPLKTEEIFISYEGGGAGPP